MSTHRAVFAPRRRLHRRDFSGEICAYTTFNKRRAGKGRSESSRVEAVRPEWGEALDHVTLLPYSLEERELPAGPRQPRLQPLQPRLPPSCAFSRKKSLVALRQR